MDIPKTTIPAQNVTDIGAAVRAKRQKADLTQAQAAALCNVSTPFLSMLENGKSSLRMDKVFNVLHGLGLELMIAERGVPLGE